MTKNSLLDFKPYAKYKNCLVNSEVKAILKKDEPDIYHYMPYSRFENWVRNSVMTFVSPYKWEDPFEKIYLRTKLLNLPNEKKYCPPHIACLCFTKSSFKDSVAFWNVFKTSETTQLVRVVFNFKQLIDQILKSLAKQKMNAKLYIAAIDYSLQQNFIQNKDDFINHIRKKSQDNQVDAESLYLKLLSCKRKAFSFENEVRFFLVPQDGKIDFNNKGCFEVSELNFCKIVKKVWLEPVRLPAGWVSEDFAKKSLKGISGKIQQSKFYEKQQECKEIDWIQINAKKRV